MILVNVFNKRETNEKQVQSWSQYYSMVAENAQLWTKNKTDKFWDRSKKIWYFLLRIS